MQAHKLLMFVKNLMKFNYLKFCFSPFLNGLNLVHTYVARKVKYLLVFCYPQPPIKIMFINKLVKLD